jgi:hypothetical protein
MTVPLAQIYAISHDQSDFVHRCEVALAIKCVDILYANTPAAQVTWARAAVVNIPATIQSWMPAITGYSGINSVWCNGTESRVPTDDEIRGVIDFLVPKLVV